jgi:hypothetical protein
MNYNIQDEMRNTNFVLTFAVWLLGVGGTVAKDPGYD